MAPRFFSGILVAAGLLFFAPSLNGQVWFPLVNLDNTVFCLMPDPGNYEQVIVGGRFLQSNGNLRIRIAKLKQVSQFGAFSYPMGVGFYDDVYALAVYQNEVYAAGLFSRLGDNNTPMNGIAKWDGSKWVPVGGGVSQPGGSGSVSALAVYKGELYAGGYFTHAGNVATEGIAKWNGSAWSAVGSGLKGYSNFARVYSFGEYDGELFVGGSFWKAGGLESYNVARWDGSGWLPVGTNGVGTATSGEVHALREYNHDLYIGGEFTMAGSLVSGSMVRWNGQGFSTLLSSPGSIQGWVYAMEVHKGLLYVGGAFNGPTVDGVDAKNIVAWDGTQWKALSPGCDAPVRTLKNFRGSMYVGGQFQTAGGLPSPYLARIDSMDWSIVTAIRSPDPVEPMEVFPNPATETLHVNLPDSDWEIEISDVTGFVCKKIPPAKRNASVDVRDLKPGIYFLKLISGRRSRVFKIIKN